MDAGHDIPPAKYTIEISINKYKLTELTLNPVVIEFCGKILETGMKDDTFIVEFDQETDRDFFKKIINNTYKK